MQVKTSCLDILQQFGVKWPPMLNCSKFPVQGEGGAVCMEPEMSIVTEQYVSHKNASKNSTISRVRPHVSQEDSFRFQPPKGPLEQGRCPRGMVDLSVSVRWER